MVHWEFERQAHLYPDFHQQDDNKVSGFDFAGFQNHQFCHPGQDISIK